MFLLAEMPHQRQTNMISAPGQKPQLKSMAGQSPTLKGCVVLGALPTNVNIAPLLVRETSTEFCHLECCFWDFQLKHSPLQVDSISNHHCFCWSAITLALTVLCLDSGLTEIPEALGNLTQAVLILGCHCCLIQLLDVVTAAQLSSQTSTLPVVVLRPKSYCSASSPHPITTQPATSGHQLCGPTSHLLSRLGRVRILGRSGSLC